MVATLTQSWPLSLKESFLYEWNNRLQPELKKAESQATPTKPLYHYTDQGAAEGILRNERLWCFSHLQQSDKTEFSYSLSIAREVIERVGRSTDWFRHNFCECLDDLLKNNSFSETFEFYLFSFSRHRDDAKQWEKYGQRGCGIAIGFAPALFQSDQPLPNERASENVWVGRVVYGDTATKKHHRPSIQHAAAIASHFAWRNRDAVLQLKPSVYLHEIAIELIASPLIFNCLTSKQKKYHGEEEVRYISLNLREKYDSDRKIHKGRAYIEVPIQLRKPGGITEILLGPRAPVGSEKMMREFLISQGYSESIPVCRSEVD